MGKNNYSIEAEGTERGHVHLHGDYEIAGTGVTMPLITDVWLLKNDAVKVIGLGGITTVNFFFIKVVFDDDTVATATAELLINDGGVEISMTGTIFMLMDTDVTSIKLTNNSHDTTGSDATVFIDLGGV